MNSTRIADAHFNGRNKQLVEIFNSFTKEEQEDVIYQLTAGMTYLTPNAVVMVLTLLLKDRL